jgi:hypothetical protein
MTYDGIQAASGSLRRSEDDGSDPVCELCHRAPVDYTCSVCQKYTCSSCSSTYMLDGTFCINHLPVETDQEASAA